MLCPSPSRLFPPAGRGRVLIAALAVAALAPLASAANPPAAAWHPDLARARTAAASSQRPVLAMFIASWSPESRRIVEVLQADAEVAALAATCFEPAVVDVDVEADLTRRLGVLHVPTAVVLGFGDEPLASFECPAEVPAFISAAAQASRDAAARLTANGPAAKGGDDALAGGPGRGSISLLNAKVRQLSSFAGVPVEPVATVATRPQGLEGSFAAVPPAAPQEPAMPRSPPTWNVERPTMPLAVSTPAPGPRPSIEPVMHDATTLSQPAATTTPWLAAATTAEPESSASVSDMPPPIRSAAAPAPTPTPATPPASKGFWSGIRNPFAKAEQPALPATKPEPPPIMPPARTQWPAPLAALAPPPAQPPAPQPAAPPAVAQAAAITAPPAATDTMPLGLEGYCPVTLAEKQSWTEGRPQYGARHRGRTYLFAGPEQQRAFLADPDRYAPALSGDDPVLAFEQGRSLQGQRRYGAYCQSRVYLFTSPETRAAFEANPDKYAARVALAERPTPSNTRTY